MFPYKTSFLLDRSAHEPLYLQLSNQFIGYIKEGKIPSGTKLMGSRSLAELLAIHRKTVVACYEELALQGWIESIPKKGTFVHSNLPLLEQKDYEAKMLSKEKMVTGYTFYHNTILPKKGALKDEKITYINDGTSDGRLTPVEELARIYRRIVAKKSIYKELDYGTTQGNLKLRTVLTGYLNATRGLQIEPKNMLITRGSQMGIWLSSQLLLRKKDVIVVGETNYIAADLTFLAQEATIKRVKVDENGIQTTAIEELCKKYTVKAIYVTSHHHHPTTVTLSAERRIHLLNLARQYHIAIIEDDYDYDFNYCHAPILPLASHDTHGNVIYIGSVCKTVAPVFRVGYLIAPKQFVDEAAKLRGFVDRQGDAILELTFAEFIKSGDLDRHIRKVMKHYKARRDLFCDLLKKELGEYFTFEIPKGGMAVWVTLDRNYSWEVVAEQARAFHLEIGDWKRYDLAEKGHNAMRIGFASYTIEEIHELIFKLKSTMQTLKKVTTSKFPIEKQLLMK